MLNLILMKFYSNIVIFILRCTKIEHNNNNGYVLKDVINSAFNSNKFEQALSKNSEVHIK